MRHVFLQIPSTVLRMGVVLLVPCLAYAAESSGKLDSSFEESVKPVLNRFCVGCHNAEDMTAGVRVDSLDAAFEDRHIKLWEAIRSQLEKGKMPPEGEEQPTKAQRQQLISWINEGLQMARARPTPKNGGARRLTVSQYRNTLRELLLVEENLTEGLPPDAVSREGFRNHQAALELSPLLLEAYFDVAEQALERCIVDPKSQPTIQNFRVDLGRGVNPDPCLDELVLGANSLLLKNQDFRVTQLKAKKTFPFEPFFMRTKYRFIEGYQGNDTVRGWREYDSIYHAVFACMRGAEGYPKGEAYGTVPEGLLLRPAIPSAEVFGVDSTYGPRANFKISVRELPSQGNFRITVTAAKYNDGLLLDPGTAPINGNGMDAFVCRDPVNAAFVTLPMSGVYQVDIYPATRQDKEPSMPEKPFPVTIRLGEREFASTWHQPAFLVARLPAGKLPIQVQISDSTPLDRMVFHRLPANHDSARRFLDFEKRSPLLGVHLGLRRDCGSTLTPVGLPQTVSSETLSPYVFEGAINDFPSPDVERDNVNYLAGLREIGVRSEYTDGRDRPRLLIQSVEFEGPFYETWPPASHQNLFGDSTQAQDQPDSAREIIRRFAARAYRRPVTDTELALLLNVFQESLAGGSNFQDSVRDGLMVVLTSPQFLFLIENSQTPDPEPVDEYELASKLSYFLCDGPPDSELLRLAASGKLRGDLGSQTERLIRDPRFTRFASEFTSQWLALEKFDVLEPDRGRFPHLTRDVRKQLRQEPVEFLQHLVRNNLSMRNLIDSDFVLANEAVASYYEFAELPDSGFQFVAIPHRRPELGGLFAQAAIQAGLSDGRESNPVKRGAWLARKIIAEPPDDPPPNVPALEETTEPLTLRERLERHRNQPGCAQCHSKIDPWGIPFEEFDAGGRLKREAVDARSTLPDKTEVNGMDDLKRYLAEDRLDQVAFSVLKHLTIYAIGRSLTYTELESLRQNALQLKGTGYRMQDMIQLAVHSPMFLEK